MLKRLLLGVAVLGLSGLDGCTVYAPGPAVVGPGVAVVGPPIVVGPFFPFFPFHRYGYYGYYGGWRRPYYR